MDRNCTSNFVKYFCGLPVQLQSWSSAGVRWKSASRLEIEQQSEAQKGQYKLAHSWSSCCPMYGHDILNSSSFTTEFFENYQFFLKTVSTVACDFVIVAGGNRIKSCYEIFLSSQPSTYNLVVNFFWFYYRIGLGDTASGDIRLKKYTLGFITINKN